MHEFPEVQAMVRDAGAQVPAGVRIKRLKIVVGEASGHDARHIEAHFAEASRGASAEGAVLEFIPEKLAATCAACGTPFNAARLSLACAQCGGTELTITAGNNVRLVGVET
jgi:Zn finger protein HypA/HybF involved in hydrogenase expression